MKRIALAAVAVCMVLAGTTATAAQTPTRGNSIQAPPVPETCLAQSFKGFAAAVWDIDLWHRGAPDGRTLAAERSKLACAPTASHRDAMVASWHRDKKVFEHYRTYRENAPFSTAGYGVCGGPPGPADKCFTAIPPQIVCGESGFDFHVNADGFYQIIPSTWAAYGGTEFSGTAGEATPLEQHIVAHRAWGHTAWYGLC